MLGLGSSRSGPWGSPAQTIGWCIRELAGHNFTIDRCSSLYETAGVGPGRQSIFVNAALTGESHLSPDALLRALKQIERLAGGRSAMPWGPRSLDIDILAYKGRVIGWPAGGRQGARGRYSGHRLSIPHPQLHLRPFVLAPLAEIAPRWRHPVLGVPVLKLWEKMAGRSEGRILRKLDAVC